MGNVLQKIRENVTTVAKAEVPDQLEKNRFYSHQLYNMYHKKIYAQEAHIMYLTVSSERLEQGD